MWNTISYEATYWRDFAAPPNAKERQTSPVCMLARVNKRRTRRRRRRHPGANLVISSTLQMLISAVNPFAWKNTRKACSTQ